MELKKINLGGWHRLWIVLSIAYLFFVIFIFSKEFPTSLEKVDPYTVKSLMNPELSSAITETWQGSSFGIGTGIPVTDLSDNAVLIELSNGSFIKISNWRMRAKGVHPEQTDTSKYLNKYGGHLWTGSKTPWNEDPSVYKFIDQVASEYERNINKAFRKEQFDAIKSGLVAWILPTIIIYFIGFSISWIYKGFKNNNRNKTNV